MVLSVRRWGVVLALAVLAGGLGYGGRRLWRAWRYRIALVEIQQQIQAQRYGAAARNLTALLAWEPGSDEAACLLGNCERARGRPQAADEAWARVPPSSGLAASAMMGRAGLLVDQGRLADVERLLTHALEDPRIDGFELRQFLAPLYWNEGRTEEARRLIEANWESLNRSGRSGSARAIKIELVRLHVNLSVGMSSVEMVRDFLEHAARSAPDDDRVWLGKANLAIRQGESEGASRWLDACLNRRREDVPIWRTRLDWALASGRVAEVREALEHLPAAESTPARIHRLAAWLAARRGDAASERQALERLIAADPGDGAALDRLAELALRDGQPDRADELRRRKARRDQLGLRYQELFLRNQTVRDAEEMARLAEQLGHSFEARAFWAVAMSVEPAREDLRAALARWERPAAPVAEPGQTLAEVLALELDAGAAPGLRSAPAPARGDSSAPISF
ncbi:MAG: tetratricopeptide repeat protein [Isosphaeraceae bacterium]